MTLLVPIKERPCQGGRTKKYHRTEWHERVLRERYDSRTETITELAAVFGVPRYTVRHWAAELGLARTKELRWSEAEEEYLTRWLHRRNIRVIARHLGRTVTAIVLKAERLGLKKSGEGYTLRQCAIGFGVDSGVIRRWIEQGKLKACRRHTNRVEGQGGDMWLITEGNILNFVRSYPNSVDLRKVDALWFLDVLVGPLGCLGDNADLAIKHLSQEVLL